ncbi:MAG: hypothetical protein N4A38_03430 [Candidatus Gracilibacteria bacterium]|nr:hypothetical protein [Candidatus Gracilibacteria bacterium]
MLDLKNIKFELLELNSGNKLEINSPSIITVISGKIKEDTGRGLNKFESSIYYKINLEVLEDTLVIVIKVDDRNILLNEIDVNKEYGDFCRKNWISGDDLFPGCGLDKADLYRSNQLEKEFLGEKYKFNYWFCGPRVNCGIHNVHNFVEIHTNIMGDGFMQKFENKKEDSLYETVGLMPGNSHRRFDVDLQTDKDGNPKYPYHRWLGGKTGNIWLVIEQY